MKRDYINILVGPTGVKKTKASIKMAKELDAEIINCDMAQIYKEGKIATGQICEIEKNGVKHYLIGFLDTPESISIFKMRMLIESAIELILSKNKKVIIVGGSIFCIYSLFFAPIDVLKNFKDYDGVSEIGVEVLSQSKKHNVSDVFFCIKYNYKLCFFDFLNRIFWRKTLNERIDKFFEDGLIEEIKNMNNIWRDFLYLKKFIGYYEIIDFYNKNREWPCEERIENIKELIFFRTCQYGKKQRTYIRKLRRDTIIFNIPREEYFSDEY
jgi:tRNA dimethylallyltransferase